MKQIKQVLQPVAGMTDKAIATSIEFKINNWLGSINDDAVRNYLYQHIIVSGGSIASMCMGTRVHDYDVYFDSYHAAAVAAMYYVGHTHEVFYTDEPDLPREHQQSTKAMSLSGLVDSVRCTPSAAGRVSVFIKSSGVIGDISAQDPEPSDEDEKQKYCIKYITSNAITLSGGIQLVLRFAGPPAEILANFDFIHTHSYWTPREGVVCQLAAVRSMQSRTLSYVGSKYPLCSLVRTRKFVARGWKAPASVFVKAMYQCTLLDWTTVKTWEDQLIGVDSAYFSMIIYHLQSAANKLKTVDEISEPLVAPRSPRGFDNDEAARLAAEAVRANGRVDGLFVVQLIDALMSSGEDAEHETGEDDG